MNQTNSANVRRLNSRKSQAKLFAAQTKLRLNSVDPTQKPQEIIDAYSNLKGLKKFTTDLESIAKNLYYAQREVSRLNGQLGDEFMNMHTTNQQNKFEPFFKMSQRYKEVDNGNEKYLSDIKKHLVYPLMEFNKFGYINKCKELKVDLKRQKCEYDMVKHDKNKFREARKDGKNVNLANAKKLKTQSRHTLEKLNMMRQTFLENVDEMEVEKRLLIRQFDIYLRSFRKYSQSISSGLKQK